MDIKGSLKNIYFPKLTCTHLCQIFCYCRVDFLVHLERKLNPKTGLILPPPPCRYRGRAINGVKGNFKNSHTDDMKCRFCPRVPNETVEDHVENEINPEQNQNYPEETQEHLEICKGTDHERRGLNMSKWQGILKFWMRMSTRLSNMSVKQRNKKAKT